jgi:hypothetical protein
VRYAMDGLILDNLSTHKPKRDIWLAQHTNVHLLNQVEFWLSILAG